MKGFENVNKIENYCAVCKVFFSAVDRQIPKQCKRERERESKIVREKKKQKKANIQVYITKGND